MEKSKNHNQQPNLVPKFEDDSDDINQSFCAKINNSDSVICGDNHIAKLVVISHAYTYVYTYTHTYIYIYIQNI